MNSPDRDKWMAACLDEIRSHTENGSWKWVELPEGASAIGSKWVFKVKRTEDGSVERYKARLVAQGFSQRPGWDFVENFAPTIRLSVVRAIFAIVAAEDMECDSLDITTAFLNGELDDTIYMKPPPMFEKYTPQGKRLYCLLLKAIYGLKQGSRQWYLKLSGVMKDMGFKKVRSEPCVYVFLRGDDRVIVPSYVDDLHIASKSKESIQWVKDELAKRFKLRDLGPSKWFLGIHITRDRANKTLSLSQRQYCLDMLAEFEMSDCKPVSTPMVPSKRLSQEMCPKTPEDIEFMKDKPYMRAVGKLIWLSLATRPDLAHSVSQLARFNANPGPAHWVAVK
jgi:Reverse transcriptase (RNA-dependent DNA polymerase)